MFPRAVEVVWPDIVAAPTIVKMKAMMSFVADIVIGRHFIPAKTLLHTQVFADAKTVLCLNPPSWA